ncbi:site-specific integrase [soil metagenome]
MARRQKGSRRRGKGSITSYQTAKGTRWRFQVWVPIDSDSPEGECAHVGKGGYLTADDANDAMQEARRQHKAGVDLAAAMPSVTVYAKRWLDSRGDLAASTVAGYRRIFDRHVNPALGLLPLDKVTATRLRKLYMDLQEPDASNKRAPEGLSKNSVHKVHVAVGAMFDAAVSDKLLSVNPARQRRAVKAPTSKEVRRQRRERNGDMVTWTGSQLRAFLDWDRDVLGDDVHALWWVIAHTGIRRSEVLALRWSDVDLEKQRIKILRALDTGKPAAQRGQVKGAKSDSPRVVDIDIATVKVIRQWRIARGALSLELAGADGYLFGQLDGEPRNPNALSQMFTRRVAKARKVLGKDALPDITLHGLRHTHATVLLEMGENPKVVQERLGQTTITTTMDVYAHVTPTMQRSAVDRFAAAVSGTD